MEGKRHLKSLDERKRGNGSEVPLCSEEKAYKDTWSLLQPFVVPHDHFDKPVTGFLNATTFTKEFAEINKRYP